jgi:hypothetical protein
MNTYKFCFSGQTTPQQCSESTYINNFVKVKKNDIFLIYYIDNKLDEISNNIIQIKETTTFLMISTINSAHSICEIISFINYYKNRKCKDLIAISEFVPTFLPLLFDLIKLFIDSNKILIINEKNTYKFNNLVTYRNLHFNDTVNWNSVNFTKNNNILKFENIEYIKNNFKENSLFLFNKVEEIYNTFKDKYELYDNIMLIKTMNEKNVSTASRGINPLDENTYNILLKNNIKYLKTSDFNDIIHFICVFYHAKNLIFSYGGPCCTNRFFCNPKANVIVIANLQYKHEYDYNNKTELYWHIRHSHLHPVKNLTFLLDFEDNINENNINNIIKFLNPL